MRKAIRWQGFGCILLGMVFTTATVVMVNQARTKPGTSPAKISREVCGADLGLMGKLLQIRLHFSGLNLNIGNSRVWRLDSGPNLQPWFSTNMGWAVLSDEQMSNGWSFSPTKWRAKGRKKVRVEYQPVGIAGNFTIFSSAIRIIDSNGWNFVACHVRFWEGAMGCHVQIIPSAHHPWDEWNSTISSNTTYYLIYLDVDTCVYIYIYFYLHM